MTQSATRDPGAGHDRSPRPRPRSGTPCWASLLLRRLADGQDFYRSLFGWEFRSGPPRTGPYVRALLDGQEVAGLGMLGGSPDGEGSEDGPPDPAAYGPAAAWLPYLACDDADATAALIREHCGTVAVGPLEVADGERMALAADTGGAGFGIRQGGRAQPPRPGVPVWYELVARDTAVAEHFYPAVFGYRAERPQLPAQPGRRPERAAAEGPEEPEERRLTLSLDGAPVGCAHGLGSRLPQQRGPHWRTYFAVRDADAAAQRAEELGGSVVQPPYDAPFGRAATVADREGAEFGLLARDGG